MLLRKSEHYNRVNTIMCLYFGTSKIINFPFVSNGKLNSCRCSNTYAHCGTKYNHFKDYFSQ